MILSSQEINAISACLAGLIFVGFLLRRSRRIDRADAGSLLVALSAGFAVPRGLFLCLYLFYPDPVNIGTKLRGDEKEIFIGGVLIFFLALASLWSVCEKAGSRG